MREWLKDVALAFTITFVLATMVFIVWVNSSVPACVVTR